MCENPKIITLVNPVEIPEGIKFVNDTGCWIVDPGYKLITRFFKNTKFEYQIDELELDPKIDTVNEVYMFDEGKLVFVYAIRSNTHTGFLIHCDDIKLPSPYPKIYSFSLSSILFHQQILSAFCPGPKYFFIISKEGISLHDIRFQPLYLSIVNIDYCFHDKQFLLIGRQKVHYIYEFNLNHDNDQQAEWVSIVATTWKCDLGIARRLIVLSHAFLILYEDGNHFPHMEKLYMINDKVDKKKILILRKSIEPIPKEKVILSHQISIQKYFILDERNSINPSIDNIKIIVYDDALLITTIGSGITVFLDLYEDEGEQMIGEPFYTDKTLENGFNNQYALCNDRFYLIKNNYQAIESDSQYLVAALFRRNDGVLSGSRLLMKILKSVGSVEKMKDIIRTVGKYAVSPVAQIRFAHAIQFCGITDPHLILIGLIEYTQTLGDKLINETKIPLIEALSHPYSRNSMQDYLCSNSIKLDIQSARAILGKTKDGFHPNQSIIQDYLDFASICIENGLLHEAEKMIIRASLDGYPTEKITKSKAELKKALEKTNCKKIPPCLLEESA